jgi:hypothetical protein
LPIVGLFVGAERSRREPETKMRGTTGHTTEGSAPDWGPPPAKPKPRVEPPDVQTAERYRDSLPTYSDGLAPLVTTDEDYLVHDTIPAPPPAPDED